MGNPGSQKSYIFISYSHKDKKYAHRLEKALKWRGFEVWLDDRIDYGVRWPKEIQERLDGCHALILIMTGHSYDSDWVQSELSRAKRKRKNIFPLLLEGDEPWLSVEATQYIDVRSGQLPTRAFYETLAKVVSRKRVKSSKKIDVIHTPELAPDEQQLEAGHVVTNSIGMKLVYIPPGSFMMGSGDSAAQLAREYDTKEQLLKQRLGMELPQHQVRISKGFWMGQTVVTQGQYESVMNAKPWSGQEHVQEDADNPAVYVIWNDAMEFCKRLGQQEGETYRLPTEAEWEYACRSGTTTRFSFGDDDSSLGDYAWFALNAKLAGGAYAHPVGLKKPNSWGLYDMHGNVGEWCSDWYYEDYYSNSPRVDPEGPSSGETRCLRGSTWAGYQSTLRCSCRGRCLPGDRNFLVGFRVVRSRP